MKITFPRPFAIAIDDLGWMNGKNDGKAGYGPYRVGIDRKMELSDYVAVRELAKKVGVRLQGLFILGEMDRENFLHEFPTTTQLRDKYTNHHNISDLQLEMMDYVKRESAYIEFGLHGVGHEFWPEDGKRRRAEWYNTDDDHPWPEEEIVNHVECFIRIMRQYGISPENGHSFPESFVPCAYSYYWNPDGDYSLGSVLRKYGVRYANTDFTQIPECNPPLKEGGGFDHGVHVLNRYNYGNLWNQEGKLPTTPREEQDTDYIETHWPNLLAGLHQDQDVVTARWETYYHSMQNSPDRYCAKNTAQMHSQWLYKKYTKVNKLAPDTFEIDNTAMPESLYEGFSLTNMVLKVPVKTKKLSSALLDEETIPAYYEDQGFGFIYLPPLLRKKYILKLEKGLKQMEGCVWHDGTSNILEVKKLEDAVKIDLCLYGTQEIKLLCSKDPKKVVSNLPGIKVHDWRQDKGTLHILASAHDIQGETGTIEIFY